MDATQSASFTVSPLIIPDAKEPFVLRESTLYDQTGYPDSDYLFGIYFSINDEKEKVMFQEWFSLQYPDGRVAKSSEPEFWTKYEKYTYHDIEEDVDSNKVLVKKPDGKYYLNLSKNCDYTKFNGNMMAHLLLHDIKMPHEMDPLFQLMLWEGKFPFLEGRYATSDDHPQHCGRFYETAMDFYRKYVSEGMFTEKQKVLFQEWTLAQDTLQSEGKIPDSLQERYDKVVKENEHLAWGAKVFHPNDVGDKFLVLDHVMFHLIFDVKTVDKYSYWAKGFHALIPREKVHVLCEGKFENVKKVFFSPVSK